MVFFDDVPVHQLLVANSTNALGVLEPHALYGVSAPARVSDCALAAWLVSSAARVWAPHSRAKPLSGPWPPHQP